MPRFLASVAALLFVGLSAVHAQQPHPALQSQQAFLAELAGKTWQCSFTTLPELRFHADKIEVLAGGQVFNTLIKVTHPEPGIVRVDYTKGFQLFIFADDLESFVIVSMEEQSGILVEGGGAGTRLPLAAADAPLTISFTDNPFWKQARLNADKMEILDGSGAVFATNPAFSYTPQVQGVALPEKRVGALILSRQKPGTGWYVNGRNLGVGVRTDKYGVFKPFLRTQLTQYALRSAHFNYPLLIAGKKQMATAQERYTVKLVGDQYGENSDKAAYCLNEMGTLRRYARSYPQAAMLHQEAFKQAEFSLATNKPALLEFATDLATSQNDAGDFARAKMTLEKVSALLPPPLPPPPRGDIRPAYLYYEALGTAEFGLRNHAVAANHFIENRRRAREAKLHGSVVESSLQLIPCQLAQSQPDLAQASLRECLHVQKEREAASSDRNYDTWKIAFACVALGRNDEAVKFAPVVSQRQNWVSYEEYGRLVSLYNAGDTAAAQSLAKSFLARFRNIQEINIRDDIDPITVSLTQAIAEPTAANIAALDQLWTAQVENLRNRPLKNYIFARVMVLTLAKLKGGR